MRKIAKSMILCEHGEIPKASLNNGTASQLAESMVQVAEMFDEEEVEMLEQEALVGKVEEVDRLMRQYGREGFGEVISALRGAEEEQGRRYPRGLRGSNVVLVVDIVYEEICASQVETWDAVIISYP